jgi:hypothetical protein
MKGEPNGAKNQPSRSAERPGRYYVFHLCYRPLPHASCTKSTTAESADAVSTRRFSLSSRACYRAYYRACRVYRLVLLVLLHGFPCRRCRCNRSWIRHRHSCFHNHCCNHCCSHRRDGDDVRRSRFRNRTTTAVRSRTTIAVRSHRMTAPDSRTTDRRNHHCDGDDRTTRRGCRHCRCSRHHCCRSCRGGQMRSPGTRVRLERRPWPPIPVPFAIHCASSNYLQTWTKSGTINRVQNCAITTNGPGNRASSDSLVRLLHPWSLRFSLPS